MIDEGIEDQKLDELSENLKNNQGKILGLYTQEPELFVDLSLLSDGFNGDDLVASQDIIFAFDRSGNKIIRI